MGLSMYRKYGTAAAKLKDAVKSGMVSHAYIFEGDNNVDKMGFARAFCQALVCRQMPGEGCGRCIECRKIADGNYEDLYIVEPEDTTAKKTGTNSIKDADIDDRQLDKTRDGTSEKKDVLHIDVSVSVDVAVEDRRYLGHVGHFVASCAVSRHGAGFFRRRSDVLRELILKVVSERFYRAVSRVIAP